MFRFVPSFVFPKLNTAGDALSGNNNHILYDYIVAYSFVSNRINQP